MDPDASGDEAIELEIPACTEKPAEGNRRLRALFGRRRSHNEQLIVRPCGIIVARETFFGSETTPQVIVCHQLLVQAVCSLTLTAHSGHDRKDIPFG